MKAWEAAKNALESVLEAVAGESIFILCDEEKKEVGAACRRRFKARSLDSPHDLRDKQRGAQGNYASSLGGFNPSKT